MSIFQVLWHVCAIEKDTRPLLPVCQSVLSNLLSTAHFIIGWNSEHHTLLYSYSPGLRSSVSTTKENKHILQCVRTNRFIVYGLNTNNGRGFDG